MTDDSEVLLINQIQSKNHSFICVLPPVNYFILSQ